MNNNLPACIIHWLQQPAFPQDDPERGGRTPRWWFIALAAGVVLIEVLFR